MKLLTAQQIKEWDQFTIDHEPISSVDLMERAANACIEPILHFIGTQKNKINRIDVFCGRGNNGGDGLAIARMLGSTFPVHLHVLAHTEQASPDFVVNERRIIAETNIHIHYLFNGSDFPHINTSSLVIDAITGTGISQPLHGLAAELVQHINASPCGIISIDLPSGLFAEVPDHLNLSPIPIIKATLTLTFQIPKLSFMHAECGVYTGHFIVLDIGLHPDFIRSAHSPYTYTDESVIRPLLHVREKFSHKGTFGHLLTIGGSFGKMGASVLMSKAGIRTGCGLVTAYIPKTGYTILQTALPEGMVITDDELEEIRHFPEDLQSFDALAVGPGLGLNEYTVKGFTHWLSHVDKPIVIDADALNMCSRNILEHESTFRFPKRCIITPHPKEFDRMAGISANTYERLEKQIYFAQHHQIVVVLKGAHTSVALPDGKVFFNTTGNVAMATAGTGDALTGVIGSLLAQRYSTQNAALVGVYLHGLAGDECAKNRTTLMASDLIEAIPSALNKLFT